MDTKNSKKRKVEELARSITIKIEGNPFVINFPNAGQLLDIESNKMLFSNSQYGALVRSNLVSTNMALDIIEMIATFTVLIPNLRDSLRINNLFSLDIINTQKLVKIYKKEFLPWYLDWLDALKETEENSSEEKSSQSDLVGDPTPAISGDSQSSQIAEK